MVQPLLATLEALALPHFDSSACALIAAKARLVTVKTGQTVFSPGDACQNYLIVVSGSVRVAVTTAGGREIVLYRVGPGEACALTTACLMGETPYDAEGRTEADVEAILLPRGALDELMAHSPPFRKFVMSAFGERLAGLIALVQEIAVRQVDKRLARYLVSHAEGGVLDTTHQALASELGTAREVVTRLLHHFADKGWVTLERGRILVARAVEMAHYADAP
ncbi:MAG: Crp/Fnr family transcriptional regulator [Beijerinckiaceae bacterium]